MQHVVPLEPGAAPVDQAVDHPLATTQSTQSPNSRGLLPGGEVGAPVQLESVVDLLGVRAAVHVDDQRVSLTLAEVGREVEPNLGKYSNQFDTR